jgi:tetratricopeptide (TPR) repeat protein
MSYFSFPLDTAAPLAASKPYYNLGSFNRPVSTTSQDAQTWFNRGLAWAYGFNFDEAILCYEQALLHDPKCTQASLFLAYALGPNLNQIWQHTSPEVIDRNLKRIHQILGDVERLLGEGDSMERGFYEALWMRFPKDESKNFKAWDKAFAQGMKALYDRHGEDLDVTTIYAESIMTLTPWNHWDRKTGEPSKGSATVVIREILERAMKTEAAAIHPGVLHLYIHLMEESSTPERAIPAADMIYGLLPDAGHLMHMHSRAVASNARAMEADEVYHVRAGTAGPPRFYTVYRMHNCSSLIYAAMFSGQYKIALHNVEKMEGILTDEVIRGRPEFLEAGKGTRVHVLVRFGRWADILAIPLPEDKEIFCVTTATIYYGRGLAFAATGRIAEAEAERQAFTEALARVPKTRYSIPNLSIDTLAVGQAMLDGELDYRRGDYDSAFKHLRLSIERYDNLVFGEPWSWRQPVRHAYAALQLERGNVQEALDTYAADLGYNDSLPRACQHPNNVWALHGYHECLTRLGMKREARIIEPQLRLALAVADVNISSSCFCRLEVQSAVLADDKAVGAEVVTGSCCRKDNA